MSSAQLAEENKDLEWDAYEMKKENAGLEESLDRLQVLHDDVAKENTALKAAAQAAAAVAEGHRAAEIADRTKILAALQAARSDFLGASWDYALSLRRGEELERRGEEQERRKQQLEQQLATANTEVAALRDARLETRLSRLETEFTLATVKRESGSDFE
jgi:hypothetical protein